MNYRHIYHAGNFADVFKHIILIMLIEALCKKDKGFLYLDTHAGIGRYDLTTELAQKTKEYENGITKILPLSAPFSAVKKYQEIIKSFNSNDANLLHFYPGSPCIAQACLRKQDQMILCELHPEEVLALKKEFRFTTQVAIHHTDGYQGLKAFLPPKTGRGLILIDPPFEEKDEFNKVVDALKIAQKRFPRGVYAVWLPIKDQDHVKNFINKINILHFEEVIFSEFSIGGRSNQLGLTSCGMLIINPPWKFAEELQFVVSWLKSVLALG